MDITVCRIFQCQIIFTEILCYQEANGTDGPAITPDFYQSWVQANGAELILLMQMQGSFWRLWLFRRIRLSQLKISKLIEGFTEARNTDCKIQEEDYLLFKR